MTNNFSSILKDPCYTVPNVFEGEEIAEMVKNFHARLATYGCLALCFYLRCTYVHISQIMDPSGLRWDTFLYVRFSCLDLEFLIKIEIFFCGTITKSVEFNNLLQCIWTHEYLPLVMFESLGRASLWSLSIASLSSTRNNYCWVCYKPLTHVLFSHILFALLPFPHILHIFFVRTFPWWDHCLPWLLFLFCIATFAPTLPKL